MSFLICTLLLATVYINSIFYEEFLARAFMRAFFSLLLFLALFGCFITSMEFLYPTFEVFKILSCVCLLKFENYLFVVLLCLVILKPFSKVFNYKSYIYNFIENKYYLQQICFVILWGLWACAVSTATLLNVTIGIIFVFSFKYIYHSFYRLVLGTSLHYMIFSYLVVFGVFLCYQINVVLFIFIGVLFLIIFKFVFSPFIKSKWFAIAKGEADIQALHLSSEFAFFLKISILTGELALLVGLVIILKDSNWCGYESSIPLEILTAIDTFLLSIQTYLAFAAYALCIVRCLIACFCNATSMKPLMPRFFNLGCVFFGACFMKINNFVFTDISVSFFTPWPQVPVKVLEGSKEALSVEFDCVIRTANDAGLVSKYVEVFAGDPPFIYTENKNGTWAKSINGPKILSMLGMVTDYNRNVEVADLKVINDALISGGPIILFTRLTGPQIAAIYGDMGVAPSGVSLPLGQSCHWDYRAASIKEVMLLKKPFLMNESDAAGLPALLEAVQARQRLESSQWSDTLVLHKEFKTVESANFSATIKDQSLTKEFILIKASKKPALYNNSLTNPGEVTVPRLLLKDVPAPSAPLLLIKDVPTTLIKDVPAPSAPLLLIKDVPGKSLE